MAAQIKLKLLDGRIEYEKLSVVRSLLERLHAEWVVRGVIARMLPVDGGLKVLKNYNPAQNRRETQVFSIAGVPGCVFQINGKRRPDIHEGIDASRWLRAQ